MRKQDGFSHIEVIIVLLVLGIVGFGGWRVLSSKKKQKVQPRRRFSHRLKRRQQASLVIHFFGNSAKTAGLQRLMYPTALLNQC